MTYDEFKQAWGSALRASGLPLIGAQAGEQTLNLDSLDRTFETGVEPIGGQDAPPFWVAARLSWSWRSVQTARTATTEEALVAELLDRDDAPSVRTGRPWLRVDVTLTASLPAGKSIPMPDKTKWAAWAREVTGRLERIEPIVPEKTTREGRGGRLEVLAWQGTPLARVTVGPRGELELTAVELSSWQAIDLPRRWDDSSRKPDALPDQRLLELFGRVKAALHAWMEVTDHLCGPVGVEQGSND